MKGALKWLLGGVIAVAALLVLAIALLGIFFDPNAYKAEIQNLARDKAQLDLKIDGDIGWSVFPWLGLEVNQISARSLDGEPLASLKQAQVSVRLAALLQGRVEMSNLLIDGLQMNLVKGADGRGNWELAQPATAKTPGAKGSQAPAQQAPAQPAATGGAPEQPATPLVLDIAGVQLKDAQVSYDDRQQGMKIALSNLNLEASEVVSGEAFPLTASFNLAQYQGQKQAPTLQLESKLNTRATLDLAAQRYALDALDLQLKVQGDAFAGQQVPLTLKGNLKADLNAALAEISGLQLELANLALSGDLQAQQFLSAPKLSGALQVPAFDAKALLKALGQPPVVTADGAALTRVAMSGRLGGPANSVELQDLKLQLDDSTFTGQLAYALDSGRIGANLKGDKLNLDAYLPPAAQTDGAAAGEAKPTAGGTPGNQERYPKTPLLPVELIRTLNLDTQLGLGELLASGVRVANLQLVAKANKGLIEVPKISGQLYEGGFDNSATIDARRTPVKFNIHKKVEKIQLGGLLRDLTQEERFSGRFDLTGDYQASGNSVYDIVHSLDGKMRVNLADGRIQGVNLVDKLCRGIQQLRGAQTTDANVADYTEFSNMSSNMVINKGVVDTQDLKASLIGVSLGGKGLLDLPKEALDYGLSLTILQELRSPNCQIEEKLHNLAFPLRCSGGFDTEPTKLCRPDTQAMKKTLADLGKRELGDKVEKKIEEKLGTKLNEKLGSEGSDALKGALKGLFK